MTGLTAIFPGVTVCTSYDCENESQKAPSRTTMIDGERGVIAEFSRGTEPGGWNTRTFRGVDLQFITAQALGLHNRNRVSRSRTHIYIDHTYTLTTVLSEVSQSTCPQARAYLMHRWHFPVPLRNRRGPPFPKRDPDAERLARCAAAAEEERKREADEEAEVR